MKTGKSVYPISQRGGNSDSGLSDGLGALDRPAAREKYRKAVGYEKAVERAKTDFNTCIFAFYEELEDFSPDDIEFSKEYLRFA